MGHEAAFQSANAASLYDKITSRTARTGVIGLGYAGLPIAVEFARAGFAVVGVDVDVARCDAINRGSTYLPDMTSLDIGAVARNGRLQAVSSLNAAGHLDTIAICVPTPLRKTKEPDLSQVYSAARAIKDHLQPGMLIVLESTTYPGTTEELVQRTLEETGMKAGADFFLAFSPERIDPGNETWNVRNVPKVVGGLTLDCSKLAATLYGTAVEQVVTVSSPRTAEMVKLLENTFRAINIGMVNELALMCEEIGLSVWEVINAAATKPFGFMPFYPGPGVGGHCIPIDPFYLSWKAREEGFEARFIDLADQVSAAMPRHVVGKIGDALNEHGKAIRGSHILLMGVAYKPEVSDVRESPALDIIALLVDKGANVAYHDPFVPRIDAEKSTKDLELFSEPYNRSLIAEADCVVVVTAHKGIDYAEIAATARVIVDTRDAIKTAAKNVFKLGASRAR